MSIILLANKWQFKNKMLTNLKIRNFKAWSQMEAKLAPLTVFFGSNSSGKSSINQLLLMLKQTVQSSDRKMVQNFGDKTTAIELGSFWNVSVTLI
jgi:predicted ATPase